MWNWLRRIIRRNTRKIPENVASRWDRRLSLLYGLFAWNAGGIVLYMVFTGRADWAKFYGLKKEDPRPPSEQFAEILGIKKAHIVRISGFRKVKEYDIDTTNEETLNEADNNNKEDVDSTMTLQEDSKNRVL